MTTYLEHITYDPQSFSKLTFPDSNLPTSQPSSSPGLPLANPRVDTIVLADPQTAFGEFLAEQAVTHGACKQARVTTSVGETLAALDNASLVFSEIDLPGGGIFSLSSQLKARSKPIRLAVISNPMTPLLRLRVLRCGVVGILDKSESLRGLVQRLSQVTSSMQILPEEELGSEETSQKKGQHDARLSVIQQLTDRQLDVLMLLAEGYSVKQVAQRLQSTLKSVDSLKYRLMKQLQFHDRVELTRYAIRERLISP